MSFDCRTINNGERCKHLRPLHEERLISDVKFCICRETRNIIWPETERSGTIREKVISITPFFFCSMMEKQRKLGLCQEAEFTINSDGTSLHWNK
jgi:hypothetical protein